MPFMFLTNGLMNWLIFKMSPIGKSWLNKVRYYTAFDGQ